MALSWVTHAAWSTRRLPIIGVSGWGCWPVGGRVLVWWGRLGAWSGLVAGWEVSENAGVGVLAGVPGWGGVPVLGF